MAYGPIGSPSRINKSDDDPVVLEDLVIRETAEKYKATPAQVYKAYLLKNNNNKKKTTLC